MANEEHLKEIVTSPFSGTAMGRWLENYFKREHHRLKHSSLFIEPVTLPAEINSYYRVNLSTKSNLPASNATDDLTQWTHYFAKTFTQPPHITIEIDPQPAIGSTTTVITCNSTPAEDLCKQLVQAIKQWSKTDKKNKGKLSDDQRKIVEEWHQQQGKELQENFCRRKGINRSTLWRWTNKYKDAGYG